MSRTISILSGAASDSQPGVVHRRRRDRRTRAERKPSSASRPASARRTRRRRSPLPPIRTIAFVLSAQGVQRYQCVQSTTAFTWTFVAPDADLFSRRGHDFVLHHFAGPTWLYKDSSSVVAARLAGATVDPTAIPWLLLGVTSHGGAPGKLTDITSIQRLETTGGNAPATGCDADHVGAEADALYTARYFFYRTSNHPNNVRCGG